jgi:uncharacterized protein (DUF885 family)
MNPDVTALADQLVALRFEQEPLEAAMLGLVEGSSGLGDPSRASEDQFIDAYRHIERSAATLANDLRERAVTLSERDVVTLDVVHYAARAAADQLEVRRVEFTISDFFNSPVAGLVAILPQLALDTAERRAQYLQRLSQLPMVVRQVGARHLEGVSRGRTPTRHPLCQPLVRQSALTN